MKRYYPYVILYIMSVICLALCIAGGVMLTAGLEKPHEHSAVRIEATPSTCSRAGNTEYWHCDGCGKYFSDELLTDEITLADTVIAPLPHTEETIKGTPATCTKSGISDGKRCKVCQTVTVEQKILDPIPHTEETIEGTPATCTKSGISDGKRCKVCQTVTVEQKVLDPLPHTEETIEGTPATCTASGISDGKRCKVCQTVTVEQKVLDPIPHTEEIIEGTPATCTASGISDGKRCKVCQTVTVEQKILDPIPHTEETIEGTPATCTQGGISDGKRCKVCQTVTVEQTELGPLGHAKEHTPEKQSDCTEQGNREYWHCTRCENYFADEDCTSTLSYDELLYPLGDHPYKQCFNADRHYKVATCAHGLEEIDAGAHNFVSRACKDCGYYNYGVEYTLNADGTAYTVTGRGSYYYYEDNVEIYAEFDGLPVTEIAANAFKISYSADKMTGVIIPDSITKIGAEAFANCKNLTSLHIPASVTQLGAGIIANTPIETLTVDEDNHVYHTLGNCIIDRVTRTLVLGCKTSVIPDDSSVLTIGNRAFYECKNLTSITVPYAVTAISDYAFYNCGNLTEITLSDRITTIGNHAFFGCSSLSRISLPKNLKTLGDYAFRNCTSLSGIVVPDGVTALNDCVFDGCSNLTVAVLSSNLETINTAALHNCEKLMVLTIPAGVTKISAYAFENCKSLKQLHIPASVSEISSYAFRDCSGLEEITVDALNRIYRSETNCLIERSTKSVILGCKNSVIPNYNVEKIAINAFYGCTYLTSLYIPTNIKEIGSYAFLNTPSLEEITVSPENANYYSTNNCIIEKSSSKLILGCKNSVIPDDGSIKEIGGYAFYYSEITSVVIPEGVTKINSSAFYGCASLTDVTLPASLTYVGTYAFNETDVKNLYIDDLKSWLNVSFANTNMNSPTLTVPLQKGGNMYLNGELLTEVTIPEGITEVKNYAFANCLSITKIVIPDFVTKLGFYPFAGCDNLTELIVGDGITEEMSLHSFKKLQTLVLGNGYPSIRSNTFSLYNELTSVTLGDNIKEIGSSAFINCTSLTEIELPKNLEVLGTNAFSRCTNLKTVTIYGNITEMGLSVFRNCTSLNDIYFDGTKEQWLAIISTNWDYNTGEYTIHFNDGTTMKKGEE